MILLECQALNLNLLWFIMETNSLISRRFKLASAVLKDQGLFSRSLLGLAFIFVLLEESRAGVVEKVFSSEGFLSEQNDEILNRISDELNASELIGSLSDSVSHVRDIYSQILLDQEGLVKYLFPLI